MVSIRNICCAALVAGGSLQRLKSREELIPDPWHEAILHLRDEDGFFLLLNAHQQRVEPASSGDVTADDELLLQVRAEFDPYA